VSLVLKGDVVLWVSDPEVRPRFLAVTLNSVPEYDRKGAI